MSEISLSAQRRLTWLELRQLKWILGNALALVSLWTLVYIEAEAEILLTLTATGVAFAVAYPMLPARLPAIVWNVAVPILLTVAVVTDFFLSQPDIIPPLVRMLLLLVLVRCLQQRRRREDMQLIMMCLFMVMLVGVLTLSITFGIQILLFTPLAMTLLFLVTLTEPVNAPYTPQDMEYRWDAFHWPSFAARVWAAQDRRIVAIIASLFFGVVAVSALIFVTIPRFQFSQSIPFLNINTGNSLSGFTERIAFGDVVNIIEDENIALRVDVSDRSSAPSSPYWRMLALDWYTGAGFEMSPSAQTNHTALRANFFRFPGSDRQAGAVWTFYLEGGISRYLPLAGRASGVRFQENQRFEFNDPLQTLNTLRISAKVLFYQTQSAVDSDVLPATMLDRNMPVGNSIELDLSAPAPFSALAYPYTTMVVPAGAENVDVLDGALRDIMSGQPLSPRTFSAAAIDYLQRRHDYSLQVSVPRGDADLMIRWLASDLPGHCELFAGAFTLLARRAGYPARVVTGFKGGSWNGYEQYFMVRNKNAHAWCEIFDGVSWIRVDPTPGGDEFTGAASVRRRSLIDIDRTLGAYFDSLKILWYRRIVKFDRAQQREMTGHLRQAGVALARRTRESIRTALQAAWRSVSGLMEGSAVDVALRAGVIALVVFVVGLYGRRVLGLLPVYRKKTQRIDPVRRRAGVWLARFQTEARRLGILTTNLPDEWRPVYLDLLCIRFGHPSGWAEPNTVFSRARTLVKQAARG